MNCIRFAYVLQSRHISDIETRYVSVGAYKQNIC